MSSVGIKTSYLPSSGGSPGQAAISREEQERIRRVIAAVHSCQGGEKLTECEVGAMISYCDAHRGSKVVGRQESGLARTVLTGDEGYILMTLHSRGGDRVIGKGACKTAKLAVSTKTGEVRVVTVCRKENCKRRAWDKAKAEIQYMQQLKGAESIVQIVAAHVTDASLKDKAYIVMEYRKGGDLFDAFVAKSLFLKSNDQRQIALDCARGLKNMRERNLIHRDIKPENVYLKKNGDIICAKIGDFGHTCSLDGVNSHNEVVGTVSWSSPEKVKVFLSIQNSSPPVQVNCAAASTEASDVWTLGLLFAATLRPKAYYLSCQSNISGQRKGVLMAFVAQDELDQEIDSSNIYPEFKSLIKEMLRVEPSKRPTMADVLREVERISKR